MRLALSMGEPDVDAMLSRITASQFREWMAYMAIEPWGEARADLRAGIVAAAVTNAHRVKGKAAKPKDFMPKFDRKPQSPADHLKIFRGMGNAMKKSHDGKQQAAAQEGQKGGRAPNA